MYFMCGENQLVIQGVSSFDKNSSYPIGVKSDTEGKVTFMIDGLENFDKNQNIFIYDNSNKTYNNIRNKNFEVIIPVGEYNDRFSLRFTDKTLSNNNNNNNIDLEADSIKIIHLPKRNSIEINNNSAHTIIKKVTLYNISGQSIINWDIENQNSQNIRLAVKKISSGIYIIKIKTSNGDISKKIIVQ
jgi:trimeric autotransporter adhesin